MWAANIFGLERGLGKAIGFGDRTLGFSDFAVMLADEINGGWAGEGGDDHEEAVGILIIDVEAVVTRIDRLFEAEALK